jgi:hypothetical protein
MRRTPHNFVSVGRRRCSGRKGSKPRYAQYHQAIYSGRAYLREGLISAKFYKTWAMSPTNIHSFTTQSSQLPPTEILRALYSRLKMTRLSILLSLASAVTAIDVLIHTNSDSCEGRWIGCLALNPNVRNEPPSNTKSTRFGLIPVLILTDLLFTRRGERARQLQLRSELVH